jgi:hypothetical protein
LHITTTRPATTSRTSLAIISSVGFTATGQAGDREVDLRTLEGQPLLGLCAMNRRKILIAPELEKEVLGMEA